MTVRQLEELADPGLLPIRIVVREWRTVLTSEYEARK
jgi:hypothetical protein